MYKSKDICIIVPTYNRKEDLEKTIISILNSNKKPGKVILLDQSKNSDSEKMSKKYIKKHNFIKYNHYKVAGTNLALNAGIEESKKLGFELTCIVADDVELLPETISSILHEFNTNKKLMGIGAVDINDYERFNSNIYKTLKFKITNLILGLFLLPHNDNHKIKILGPYGNTATPYITKDINDCQWLPGFTNCYKTSLYDEYKIPDRIGYDVIEDIDMGHYTYKKYGKGSLKIPLKFKVKHNYSMVERYADRKRIFVNHEDHFAFYYRHFNNFPGTIKFLWEILWIINLNFLRAIIKPDKINLLKVKYLFEALNYCIKNRMKIKQGKSRIFLNPDLSMRI